MISTLDEREPLFNDFDFQRQAERQRELSQLAFDEIVARTPEYDITKGCYDYDEAVADMRERVVYAESWQRLGMIVINNAVQQSPTYHDMLVVPSYDTEDSLEARIAEVSAEMSVLCQSPRPETATRLKLLELDHILLTAQRPESVDRKEVVAVALSGIEQVEYAVHNKYQTLLEYDEFTAYLNAEFEELDGKEVSVEEVMAVEKHAFDSLVANTYDVEELQEIHELAVEMQEEIRLREKVLELAQRIVPQEAVAVQERIAELIPVRASLSLAA